MTVQQPGPREAVLRFYGPLNDFLSPPLRQRDCPCPLFGTPAVKDVIEALGVPHPEVERVVINGAEVSLGHNLAGGERVAVYPPLLGLRPGTPPRRFVLDVHLGRLARDLRLLGFDCHYDPALSDAAIVRIQERDGRTILTRDRGLLKHGAVRHGAFVRATDPAAQLVEVVRRFDLAAAAAPFTRCRVCNGALADVDRETILERLPPAVARTQNRFRQCGDCGRIYWPGSHYDRMRERLEGLLGIAPDDDGTA